MFFNSDGEFGCRSIVGDIVGEIEMGRVDGEWEEARGLGLELRLRTARSWLSAALFIVRQSEEIAPERFALEPGVTASNAEPKLP